MKTKSGLQIPAVLATELNLHPQLHEDWNKLRPSCQRDYVERIRKASPEKRAEKIERIIALTKAYADKHPDKFTHRNR